MKKIWGLTIGLIALYLLKILFRYLCNYLTHKADWNLVEDLRVRVYSHIQGVNLNVLLINRSPRAQGCTYSALCEVAKLEKNQG